ncbi:hypothetical protein [Novipirellula artificiosorum]|uniref:Uncharacterized protein n=1 Tax=Novipirellula artificiosorum TaxID=2528016 RepID=A0A5C6DWS9_9BACT|nr:hypothetical protein [Novipirellula artificiosorum]TWU41092.1 hypothetical protein Poly41_19290 [Novipirellula artificiosorum]
MSGLYGDEDFIASLGSTAPDETPCALEWSAIEQTFVIGGVHPPESRTTGQGTGQTTPFISFLGKGPLTMNVDTLHAALGILFTAVWLIVGQILVGGR